MIGLLRHKLILKTKPVKTGDGRGGWITNYNVEKTICGAISSLSAYEILQYKVISPEVSHKILIRYDADIDNESVFYYRNKKYEILGPPINPGELNKFQKVICKEVIEKK